MLGIEIIKYSIKNLLARKSRGILTILSIFIGITTIFIFISFGLGLYSYVEEIASEAGVDKFIVQAKGIGAPGIDDTFKLTDDDLNTVKKTKGVKDAAGFYFRAVKVEKDNVLKYVFGMGYDVKISGSSLLEDILTVDIMKGRKLKNGDSNKVILGYNYMAENMIFEKPYDLGQKIFINGKKFDIIGFYEAIGNPGDDSNIYMTDDDLKEIFPDDKLSYGMLIGSVYNTKNLDQTVASVEKNLRKLKGVEEGKENFFVQTYEEMIEQFSSILNIIIGFIILIALVSVLVSAVNTANTMMTSVLERTKEIGIMKSTGAKNSLIMQIFLFESSLLGTLAGVIGVTFGWIISNTMGNILDTLGWGFLSPVFPWYLFVGSVVFATIVGTISGVAVAIAAAKKNPVDALRYE